MSDNKRQSGLPPGSVFGRYTVEREIGTGGMGAVYEAMHNDLKKRVALKILHPEYAAHDEVQARFLREGESASRIRHPHVVDVTDFGLQDGTPFLVMEFLEGESLSDLLDRENHLSVDRTADLMLPVCAAVGAAHDAAVIHRDLKPDNVFLEKKRGEAVPKVVDFGISKVTEDQQDVSSLTSTGAMVGTPSYMSPEQMRTSKQVDARTDQYALGVMMYECVTGEKPFVAETLYEIMNKIVHGDCVRPRERRPEIAEGFEAVVMRAMSADPARRYASVRVLGHELLPFASRRQQMLWGPEFGDAVDTPPPAEESAAVPVRTSVRPSGAPAGTLGNTGREIASSAGEPASRTGSRILIAAGLVVLVGATTLAWQASRANRTRARGAAHVATPTTALAVTAPRDERYTVSVNTQPPNALIEIDGQTSGLGSYRQDYPRDGTQHTLRAHAPGYEDQTVLFRDTPPPDHLVLRSLAETPPNVAANPAGTEPARGEHSGGHHHSTATAGASGDAEAHAAEPVHATAPAHEPGPAVGTNGAAILQ